MKRPRPDSLDGWTTRVQTGHSTIYVICNEDPDDPSRIFEVFATPSKSGAETCESCGQPKDSTAPQCEKVYLEALCRIISLGLRYGVPQEDIIEQLKNLECVRVRDPDMNDWIKSPADGIAKVMEAYSGSKNR